MSSKATCPFLTLSLSVRLPRYPGGSDCLPQAVFGYGVQAPFCLGGALVSCPVDKTPRELRARPYPNTDQGTGAQHRQVVSPDTGADEPRGVLLRTSSLQ